jgi:hypothetical protein
MPDLFYFYSDISAPVLPEIKQNLQKLMAQKVKKPHNPHF